MSHSCSRSAPARTHAQYPAPAPPAGPLYNCRSFTPASVAAAATLITVLPWAPPPPPEHSRVAEPPPNTCTSRERWSGGPSCTPGRSLTVPPAGTPSTAACTLCPGATTASKVPEKGSVTVPSAETAAGSAPVTSPRSFRAKAVVTMLERPLAEAWMHTPWPLWSVMEQPATVTLPPVTAMTPAYPACPLLKTLQASRRAVAPEQT